MKYTMRSIEYEMPETIQDRDELRRLEWIMKNSRDIELRQQASGLVGDYYGVQQQNKDRQWEMLHRHRDLFVADIQAIIRLYLENGEQTGPRLGKKIDEYFKLQNVHGVVYTNGRYWFEIWTIALLIAGRKINEEGVTYKLNRKVMEEFVDQGKEEHWYEDIKGAFESEKRALLKEQGIVLQPLQKGQNT